MFWNWRAIRGATLYPIITGKTGVGPVDKRPTCMELAWHRLESNHFGTDAFMYHATSWAPSPPSRFPKHLLPYSRKKGAEVREVGIWRFNPMDFRIFKAAHPLDKKGKAMKFEDLDLSNVFPEPDLVKEPWAET